MNVLHWVSQQAAETQGHRLILKLPFKEQSRPELPLLALYGGSQRLPLWPKISREMAAVGSSQTRWPSPGMG